MVLPSGRGALPAAKTKASATSGSRRRSTSSTDPAVSKRGRYDSGVATDGGMDGLNLNTDFFSELNLALATVLSHSVFHDIVNAEPLPVQTGKDCGFEAGWGSWGSCISLTDVLRLRHFPALCISGGMVRLQSLN